jgi:hypothetical protein
MIPKILWNDLFDAETMPEELLQAQWAELIELKK